YDSAFRRRPVQSLLPLVPNEIGVFERPVIGYTAYESRGYGSLVSLDSVYVNVLDPRGHWTRSWLNRWGQARITWDALGTLGRTSYLPEGLVASSEGKVADSSRVYRRYDSKLRLAKTYVIRVRHLALGRGDKSLRQVAGSAE